MTERELQREVIALAKFAGWRIAHFSTSRSMRDGVSFMTAQLGHRGFPDLVLLRPPRLIFAELKSQYRKPTQEQALWLNGLDVVPNVEQYLWRPRDWQHGFIEDALR